jgi:hypothetical protein
MSVGSSNDIDAPPTPPTPPGADDCCRGGCDLCVFDLYAAALERYRADLREWHERKATVRNAAPPN